MIEKFIKEYERIVDMIFWTENQLVELDALIATSTDEQTIENLSTEKFLKQHSLSYFQSELSELTNVSA